MWGRPSHKDSSLKTIRKILFCYGGSLHKDFLCGGCIYIKILYVGEAITEGFPSKTIRKFLISYGRFHYIRNLYMRNPLHSDSLWGEHVSLQ